MTLYFHLIVFFQFLWVPFLFHQLFGVTLSTISSSSYFKFFIFRLASRSLLPVTFCVPVLFQPFFWGYFVFFLHLIAILCSLSSIHLLFCLLPVTFLLSLFLSAFWSSFTASSFCYFHFLIFHLSSLCLLPVICIPFLFHNFLWVTLSSASSSYFEFFISYLCSHCHLPVTLRFSSFSSAFWS